MRFAREVTTVTIQLKLRAADPVDSMRLNAALAVQELPMKRNLLTGFVLFAALIIRVSGGCTALMADTSTAPQQVTQVEGITEYLLDNGLKVLLVPDPSKPTVTVNMTVFVGSRHEGYGEAGIAHLLEHMVFKGTPNHPLVPKVLQARGARFNGTTWVDRTNYFETLPATADNLEFAIRLEADRLVNSFIKGEDLASEMTVVRNEFERGENSPSRVLSQRMMSAAYEWHNYGKSTIGNRSDIERVPVEKLRDFYKRFYQPDNVMLVVAGSFDEERTLDCIQDSFGKIPRPERVLDATYTEEPAQDGERTVMLRRVGEVAVVGVAYHVPAGSHPEFAAVEVLEQLLTSAPSGRVYKALVDTKKASSISGVAYAWHDPGVVRIMAEVSKGNAPEVVLDSLVDTVEGVGSSNVTDAEVERAKTQILKQRELSATDTRGIAVELSEWAAQGDWRLYFLHRDRLEAVTPSHVREAAARYLRKSNRTVGLYLPSDESLKTDVPAVPSVAEMLKGYQGRKDIVAGEAFDVSPENIERRTNRVKLAGGIQAAFLPKKTRGESVVVRLTLRYGSPASMADVTTATEFLPELMLRGTKQLNREQLQDELDRCRTRLSAMGSTGVAIFSLQTTRQHLPRALELLRQVIREPSFPAEELDVLKRRQVSSLEQESQEPRSLASRQLSRQLAPYPVGDVRYLPTYSEELGRVQKLELTTLQRIYERMWGGQVGQVSVVGDFDIAETQRTLETLLADWTAPEPFARIERSAPEKWESGDREILTPDKANAVYYAGLTWPQKDDDADYPALVIGDYIFGAGALSSRLGDRIRQREGLSYGVASSLNADSLDPRATMTIMAISNPANVPAVDKAVREELLRLVKDGPSAEELERAKTGYLQRQQVSRTDDSSLAQTLNSTLYAGRTMKYYSDQESRITALTAQQVTAALQKYIDPQKLAVVRAGDFKK